MGRVGGSNSFLEYVLLEVAYTEIFTHFAVMSEDSSRNGVVS